MIINIQNSTRKNKEKGRMSLKRRIIALGLASIMMMGAFVGCGKKQEDTTSPGTDTSTNTTVPNESPKTAEKKYDKEVTVTVARRGDVRIVDEDLFAPVLKEKFNLVLDVIDINPSDFVTKMNLSFASGEQPDVNTAQRPEFMLSEWTEAGYLRGYTMDELKELVPSFVDHYTDEEWDVVWPTISHSDNKAYYLPSRRADVMNMAWLYRKDTFEELGLTFPESTDGLIDVMRAIKGKTGRIPYVAASSDNVLWAFTGFLQAFGMPELTARDLSYVDPISGEFEPYAFTSEKFREHTKFMNQLYKEGLIWQEFATGTTDQVNAMKSQGHNYIQWGYPDKIDTEYNRFSQNADPGAEWDWATVMLSNDPSAGTFFKAGPFHAADGFAFSTDADDEAIDRFMDYMDWLYTEEGMAIRTYGFEGVTYTKEGDNYVFMDQMTSPIKSEGKTVANYGVVSMGMQHPNLNSYYKPYLDELANTFMNRDGYYYHVAPVLRFTDEESSKLADIQVSLTQTTQEYYAKFIMGHIDPNNDADWNTYISTMEKLGLEDFKKIRTEAYKRNN